MNNSTLILMIPLIAGLGLAQAASDGALDGTSTGTSDIILEKDDMVQITGLADIDLGSESRLTADASASDDVCVFSTSGSYSVTVSSANGSFILQDINTASDIAYEINWTVDNTPQALTYNTASTAIAGNNNDPTCGGTPNASFEVVVPSAGFNAASPGTYIDTLTLLLSPE